MQTRVRKRMQCTNSCIICNSMKKKKKKMEKQRKCQKVDFGHTYTKIAVAMRHQNIIDTQLTYQNSRAVWMKSYWNFQPLRVNFLFKSTALKQHYGKIRILHMSKLIANDLQKWIIGNILCIASRHLYLKD